MSPTTPYCASYVTYAVSEGFKQGDWIVMVSLSVMTFVVGYMIGRMVRG